jgi:hypothetical protein
VVIDVGVVDYRVHLIGWANYLLVWGTFHQLGFAWHDGTLTAHRRPILLTTGAVVVLVGLIWLGPYPVSMVGVPGARIQNASPPSTALLAFGLAQSGLALVCEPAVSRWLSRHARARSRIAVAGRLTMPIYLWHMVPVVIVIEADYPHLVGLPAVGTTSWWQQRIAWIAALSLVLAVVLGALALLLASYRRYRWPLPTKSVRVAPRKVIAAYSPSRAVAGLLVAGVIVAAAGIGTLAVNGFAPHGHLNSLSLLAVAVGLLLAWAATSRLLPRRHYARSPTAAATPGRRP